MLTSYSLLAALLSVVATCTHSLPYAKSALTIAIIAFLLPALVSNPITRSLLTPATAALVGTAYISLIVFLPFRVGSRTPGLLSIELAQLLLLATIECSVLAWMHRRLNATPEDHPVATAIAE